MGQLFLMFVLALSPIICLIIALIALKQQAWIASFEALAVAVVVSMAVWHMKPVEVATAALEGCLFALWPIVIVIIAAVYTYNLTVCTHAMDKIKQMLTSVSSDRRVLTLLIVWCFGNFMEGMAGFGTAVAIPASMMMALGVDPIISILACLIANGTPTMFGSIGIPTTTLASITGIVETDLAFTQALQVFPFVIACPFLMVMLVGGGFKSLKGVVPITLVAGLSFAIPELIAARFIGAALPDVVGAVCSLACTFLMALRMKGTPVPEEERLKVAAGRGKLTVHDALVAWSPFILIFVVLLLTSSLVPFISQPLSAIKTQVQVYAGENPATLTFSWINTPGVLILLCGIAGGLIQGCPIRQMLAVLAAAVTQMAKPLLTMLGVLSVAKIMGYSGMIASIAAFFVGSRGNLYPLVAPALGALGTFVTGSGTSSEVLFGNVQLQAAQSIGVNETWLVASNSLGISAGKMISPQNVAIGCAACDLSGKDGEIIAKIAPYAFGFLVLMMAMTYAGVMMGL